MNTQTQESIKTMDGNPKQYRLCRKFIGRDRITRVKSTTKLSVKEMSEYQMKIEAYAANLGWSE